MISKNLHSPEVETMANMFDPKADSLLSDEETQQKKERYRLFNPEVEMPKIAQAVFGRLPEDFKPLPETSNAIDHVVYTMMVAVNGRVQPFICRINIGSIPETYLLAEELLYKRWQEHSVPVPRIFATRLRDAAFPYDFTVAERVGTGNLEAHLSQHEPEAESYVYQAGALLAKFHQVEAPGFGHASVELAQRGILHGTHSSWSAAVLTQLPETLSFLRHHDLISLGLAQLVETTLHTYQASFELAAGVTLHGDYHHANIIIDADEKRLVAAVDASQAKIGDPLFDIAFYGTYYADPLFARFVAGYSRQRELPASWPHMVALYQLRILISKIKLRKRFGYEALIPRAVAGIERALRQI